MTASISATYTGPDRAGYTDPAEVLRTGDTVRIIVREDSIAGPRVLVDLPSDAYGTGRTYTVWNVPAEEVGPARPLAGWSDSDIIAAERRAWARAALEWSEYRSAHASVRDALRESAVSAQYAWRGLQDELRARGLSAR